MNDRIKTRRTFSWTSKSNHSQIVNDDYIQNFLKNCRFPSTPDLEPEKSKDLIIDTISVDIGNKHILTVDGDYTIVKTKKEFPSSEVAFFQFGAVLFSINDLDNLSTKPFILPEDMNELHNLQKTKFAIPVKNVTSSNQPSLNDSIRKEIYNFFLREKDSVISLMETLSWLIFEDYSDNKKEEYILSSNPNLGAKKGEVSLFKSQMKPDYTFVIDGDVIYLTDVFRLHEVIDEDFGATGILGYISRLIEQILLIRYLYIINKSSKTALDDFVFISNGPLSFSGQTANMHKPLRNLCNHLLSTKNLYLFGIEKSGPFVEHAIEICKNDENKFYLEKGKHLLLSNEYIYKYITPGNPKTMHYGNTSYYGGKIIIHTEDEQIFVISVPIEDANIILSPKKNDYKNLDTIISVLKRLKCDMYDDTIIPIAIANKLIALTGHPSQAILEQFAKNQVHND